MQREVVLDQLRSLNAEFRIVNKRYEKLAADRQRLLVRARAERCTWDEICSALEISRQRAHQIVNEAQQSQD